MYKVFFNEQVLQLFSKEKNPIKEPFIEVNSEKEIPKIIDDFIHNNISINLTATKLDLLLEWIKNQFIYLEAAGGIVENKEKEILFIYRLNYWDLPKGKIEKGETPKEAAYREINEECGVKNHLLKKEITQTFHIYSRNNEMHLKKTFWFIFSDNTNEELTAQTEEGIEKVVWLDNNEIELALENTYLSILEVYQSYKKMTF
jgi:ADP-ribose pyrophosphatase YjhB (NUDIX family)